METSGAGGSSTGGIFDQVMKYVEMALNPLKLIEGIIGACTGGGDQVSQSTQPAAQESNVTPTEMWESVNSQGYAKGRTKQADQDMLRALDVLDQNFDLFDTGNGKTKKDGKISKRELQMIANDASLPTELRDAASNILQDPQLFLRLDREGGGTSTDQAFTHSELQSILGKAVAEMAGASPEQSVPAVQQRPERTVQQGTEQHLPQTTTAVEVPDRSGLSTGTQQLEEPQVEQQQSAVSSTLDDPNTSFEGKTNLVLDSAMDQAEEEAIAAYKMLDEADAQSKAAKGEEEQARADANMRRVTMTVQRTMQRRQEMFELLSNMNTMFHDMAMTAIHNIKG